MTDETPASPFGRRRRAPRQEAQGGEHGWRPTASRPEPKNPPEGKAGVSQEPEKSD